MAAEGRTRRLDLAVAALAERQHGVAGWAQLVGLGMSRDELRTRVAAGRLHRLHRGVYGVVGPRLLRIEGHWLAAVLAVGDGAPLSHRSAAALWDLMPATARASDVTVARKRQAPCGHPPPLRPLAAGRSHDNPERGPLHDRGPHDR
jgi:hypothetical protein